MKNFLSKLWSLSRTDRVRTLAIDAVSLPSFCRVNMLKFVSVLVLILTIGVGNVWADYTVGFATSGSDVIASGGNYVSTATRSGSTYIESDGLRFGKGSGTGSITVTLTSSGTYVGQIKASKITLKDVKRYGSDASVNVKTTVTYTDDTTKEDNYTAPNSASDHDISLTSSKTIKSVKIESTANGKRFYCKGFTVVAAAAPSYTITATRNNNDYGTVSVTGTTITATPNSGYRVMSGTDGYTVTSGSATVVNNGDNTFTVTPSSNCTVQINFESKGCTDHGASSITTGSSTSRTTGPLEEYYNYSTRQILYSKTDLGLPSGKKGTIKSISFKYAGSSAMSKKTSVDIYLANTALTTLSTSSVVPFSSFTKVYSGSLNCAAAGWHEFLFNVANFEYNGIGSLAVMIDDNSGAYDGQTYTFYINSATGSQIHKSDDYTNENPSTINWSSGATVANERPHAQFCIFEEDMMPSTVTLMDNGATITEVSAGAGVTLPSRAGCTGYTFAGWTKTWVAPQSSWTTTAPTIIPAGSYTPSANENLYPVYTKTEGGGSPEFSQYQQVALGGTITAGKYLISTGSYTMAGNGKTGVSLTPGTTEAAAREYTVAIVSGTTITIKGPDNKYIGGLDKADGLTFSTTTPSSDDYRWVYTENGIQNKSITGRHIKAYSTTDFRHYGTGNGTLTYFYKRIETSGSTTSYISVPNCCTDPGLNYGTGSVTKTYGADAFTNTLTNSHSVAVTYSSSDPTVATVNGSGQVTILKAGSTTITASSAAQTVAAVSYCADEASYTLTVNKANISPTLTYTPNSVAVGENTSAPTVGGNPGSGGVTYTITSATPAGCATINTSTGVVTGVAVGSVTVTATVAATTNYNGNTATATVTITAASYFPQNKTLFFEAKTQSESAWKDGAQCKAWFRDCDSDCGEAPWTYWQTDGDSYKKYYAVVIPSTGNYPYITIQRYSDYTGNTSWGEGGAQTYSTGGGSNVIKSTCASGECLSWSPTSMQIYLRGDLTNDEWASNIGELTDQNGGIWSYTYNNFASDGSSLDFKLYTNYNTWIGNTSSNNNATLSGMNDGSTYNITATYNVVTHSLVMSKTFVKGTVHFDLQGHGLAISDLTNVAAGSKISAPSEPSATGWDFGGWFKEPACTNEWNFASNEVDETMTLYAKWTKHTYTITSTLNNCSSSPAIPSSYEYTGSAASLSYTITPSSGYRLPTTISVSGVSYTWDSSTGALVLTGTITSNVTITISAVQTHTVDWYVGGSAPANKIGDDGQTTVVDHGGKISNFPAHDPDGSACDKEFVGWTNTSSYVHGTSPLFNDVAGSPVINTDASFYAVFAEVNSVSASLTKMTADDDLEVGDKIVIIAQDTRYGMYQASASSYVSYWTTTDVDGEPSLSEIEADDKKYLDVAAGGATDTWKLGDATNGYLYNSSSTNLEFSTTSSSDLTLIKWTDDSFTLQAGQYISCRTDITGANANKWRGAGASCDPENDNNCSGTEYYYLYKYVPGGTTATGHTINCADCGSSVTVSYSAPGSGNTMTVTKNAAAVASGSTVKTCTSQDLTVILTPATHYDLTGFTATGLTTGTATITPAVGSTLPVSVAQTFTVTVSAGATGTLTLAPTFTAQTPLSITLETHSKGTFTPIGDIYSGESFTFPTVTPSDAECSSFLGWIEGTTWSGDGTETDPTAITGLANYHAAGSSSGTLTTTKTYTAVFGEKDTQVIPAYQKVTSAPSNWSGDYLIVRDANSRAFDGSLSTLDAADNYIGVTISDGSITANSTVNASKWTIAKVGETSNYTIKSASGYYIGRTANSNGLNSSTSEEYTNTLAYSTDHVDITSSAGPKLQMNGGARFRYYGTSQQVLQLYKYNPDAEVVAYTYCTNPACTPRYRVTMNSATGGSPSADKVYEHADETITLTANPSSGYSFTSWTITKTTGGDNVTSTLLTGDKPTTANTTFTMPAYDITIAATYTKKMVSTLEVKDGATVVSTTTGPVSGTVNISTGANKTLDVVITPSDAYDHSWTATVSAGSTYASITNVTDDGFRVNGLAQGDATITVNAPNDGSAKSVTLTVQVRDIMPEEIILKRDGSNTPIETLIMYYDETNSKGQYVKVNVGYSPANPTNKAFTFSSALTGKVGSHSHAPASGYEVLVANGVTSDAVNCTFTSSADGSVTKVLAVTVLPILSDRFVDYVHGNATQTVSARLSDDRYSIIPDINTPSLSDASDANPTSEDCETSHYHLVGWLPQTTAEALWAAGTPITDATEGLVRAGESVEATGQTWCAIWAEEAE